MQFHLDEDQLALKDSVARVLRERCRDGLSRRAVDGDGAVEDELSPALFDLGIGGLLVPEEHGGLGLGLLEAALVSDCMGYEAVPWPFLGHSIAVLALSTCGDAAQKRAWLPRLATGDARATFAFAEEGERWSPDSWTLPVTGGRVSGRKRFVLGADTADLVVVGTAGGGLALAEMSGVTRTEERGLDGTRRISVLAFDEVAVEPLTAGDADAVTDALLVLLAADAHGCMRRCIDMTVAYAGERRQFGRPIGSFQGLKHQLANATADMVPTEAMYWYAAVAGALGPAAGALSAAQTKAHVTDRAVEVARLAVEMHGGIGYTWEYDLQIWLKRAMFDYAYGGTPQAHRARAMDLADKTEADSSALADLL